MLKYVALAALAAPATCATPSCARRDFGYADPKVLLTNGGLRADARACQGQCAASEACEVFTYYEVSRECWLQGGGLEGQDIPGAVGGPRSCPPERTTTTAPRHDPSPQRRVILYHITVYR